MKNSTSFICALSLLIFAALACSAPSDKPATVNTGNTTSTSGQNSTTGAKTTPEAPAAIKVTANELMQAYVDNKVKADETYKDKTVELSGTVDTIGKDITDTPYITLKTKEMLYSVQVYFTAEDTKKLGDLKKGQSIKVTGKCTGAMGNVNVKDAVLK